MPLKVQVREAGSGLRIEVGSSTFRLPRRDHDAWLDFHAEAAADLGTRAPLNRRPFTPPPSPARLTPVLTEAVSPDILYGYGDPCVLRVEEEEAWYLAATSNDAPNAFPILRSTDLAHWALASFAFPAGSKPAWCLDGPGGDFWAPEIHRVGAEYWLVFCAREPDGRLALGLAKADAPAGPWRTPSEPLLRGGVIDPHLLITEDGPPLLYWKVDDNGVWPRLVAELLIARPQLTAALFETDADRATARLAAALWPWARTAPQMEQFFVLQPLIEAAAEDLPGFEGRLSAAAGEAATPILHALKTRVFAQPLTRDGALTGEPTLALQNDLPWEAHLIEGVWVSRAGPGRYVMVYAANDFSTPQYGIGAAVAEHPLGPWRKLPTPLVGSSAEWVGPGHPSIAPGPDGAPRLFLHAFFPGCVGYKAFRAVLSAGLELGPDGVRLAP